MPRVSDRKTDTDRTNRLGIPELYVLKTPKDEYHTWSMKPEPDTCPSCGEDRLTTQNRFSRTYIDLMMNSGTPEVHSMVYEFYKYRCQNPDCRHIFAIDIDFATVNDNVTHRLEDYIVNRVIAGDSYSRVQQQLRSMLSKPAIGQIFNRWVHSRHEGCFPLRTPKVLGIFTGETAKEPYVLFISCDDGLRVLDIMHGIESERITAYLKQLDARKLECVLTDCNEILYNAVTDTLPNTLHIIPVEAWYSLVTKVFAEYSHAYLRWSTVRNKDEIILTPPESLSSLVNVKKLLRDRPELEPSYTAYHDLGRMIRDQKERVIYEELAQWIDGLDDDFKASLTYVELSLKYFENAIRNDTIYRDKIPAALGTKLSRLDKLLSSLKPYSDEALKAVVLYGAHTNADIRCGIPIDDIINTLQQRKTGGTINE